MGVYGVGFGELSELEKINYIVGVRSEWEGIASWRDRVHGRSTY